MRFNFLERRAAQGKADICAAYDRLTDKAFFEREIRAWKTGPERREMLTGLQYYEGRHDILRRRREVIGEDGKLAAVDNLPNNRIVDNQYAKMVDQKVNYLLGKPLTIQTDNAGYARELRRIFNKRFLRTLRNLGQASVNGGIGWLHPHYDEAGAFCIDRFPAHEILPFWTDAAHGRLDCAMRIYEVTIYEGKEKRTAEKAELYTREGVYFFDLSDGQLIPDAEQGGGPNPYFTIENELGERVPYNWNRVPLIAFKYSGDEIPLIRRVKGLQDGINSMLSDFQNNMQEDSRNTILVIKNYDGEDLGQFRRNLAAYGAVKVRTVDGAAGEVDTLQVEVSADNYKAILSLLKRALIENARGFDAKDERMTGQPNQMNIQSMYSDIDLDANGMETEYQAAFEELIWFIDSHLANCRKGNYFSDEADIIFNRDILINETESIENCVKSRGILSDETILSQHPWTANVEKELARVQKETGAQ